MNQQTILNFSHCPMRMIALEPFIDKLTVEIHYSKHHKAYLTIS